MKVKKLVVLVLMSICFLCAINVKVLHAISIDDSNAEIKKNITYFWAYLKGKGFTDYAIAGIVGNFYWESGGFKTDAIEKANGEGYGLGQWSKERKTAFFSWCAKNKYDKSELSTQCEYLVYENARFYDYKAGSFTYKAVVSNLKEYSTHDWSSASEAATAFCWGWERPKFASAHLDKRLAYAEDALTKFRGTSPSGGEGTSGGTLNFGDLGWLSEDTFGVPERLQDTELYLPDDKSLHQNDLTQISRWREDIKASKDWTVIGLLRALVAFFGIVIILYSAFLYIAYWFDRINNFIEVSLLSLLTMGRIEISPDDKQSTFSPKTKGLKIVIHRDMIFICLTGILFGLLVLTGRMYLITGKFIEIVKSVLY